METNEAHFARKRYFFLHRGKMYNVQTNVRAILSVSSKMKALDP